MDTQQESHLERIKYKLLELVDSKYRRGQSKHGGDLLDMGLEELLENALDEAIDQAVYILTILEKIKGTKTEVHPISIFGKCMVLDANGKECAVDFNNVKYTKIEEE